MKRLCGMAQYAKIKNKNVIKRKRYTLKFATLLFNNLMPFGQKQSISIETCIL